MGEGGDKNSICLASVEIFIHFFICFFLIYIFLNVCNNSEETIVVKAVITSCYRVRQGKMAVKDS